MTGHKSNILLLISVPARDLGEIPRAGADAASRSVQVLRCAQVHLAEPHLQGQTLVTCRFPECILCISSAHRQPLPHSADRLAHKQRSARTTPGHEQKDAMLQVA